jgi:hypothetical protein
VFDAIEEARKNLGPREYALKPAQEAHKQLDVIERGMLNRQNAPSGSIYRTLEGFDQAKQHIWDMADTAPKITSNALKTVWSGTVDAIDQVAPGYQDLMKNYQGILEKLNNIQSGLKTKSSTAANAELAAFMRAQNSPSGRSLMEALSTQDPTIPYKVAGATFHEMAGSPGRWPLPILAGHFGTIGASLFSGNVPAAIAATTAAIGHKVLGSPGAVKGMAYGLGKAAPTAGAIGAGVKKAESLATPTAMGMQNIPRDEDGNLIQPLARKSGGRVSDRLIRAVDQAKKNINKGTEALLKTPDSHVAHALEVANRNLEG